jgi:hypothetical protein
MFPRVFCRHCRPHPVQTPGDFAVTTTALLTVTSTIRVTARPYFIISRISIAGCCWKKGCRKGIASSLGILFSRNIPAFQFNFLLQSTMPRHGNVTGPRCRLRPFQAGTSARRDCSGTTTRPSFAAACVYHFAICTHSNSAIRLHHPAVPGPKRCWGN